MRPISSTKSNCIELMASVSKTSTDLSLLAVGDGHLCEGITKTRFSRPKMIQKNTSPYSKISWHDNDMAAGVCQAMLWSCNEPVQSTLHLHFLGKMSLLIYLVHPRYCCSSSLRNSLRPLPVLFNYYQFRIEARF